MRDVLTALALALVILAGLWFYLQEADVPPGDADTGVAESESGAPVEPAAPAAASDPAADAKLDAEARRYVENITRPAPLTVVDADKFVRRDQAIALLPPDAVESVRLRDLLADPALGPRSTVTVIRQTEQIEAADADRLAAEGGLALERGFHLREDGTERTVTARELLQRYLIDPNARVDIVDGHGNVLATEVKSLLAEAGLDFDRQIDVLAGDVPKQRRLGEVLLESPDAPVKLIRRVEDYEVKTLDELRSDPARPPDDVLQVIRKPYGLAQTTVGELLGGADGARDAVYYVRTVRPSDTQGIWGITQWGLIDNFARGIAINRGEDAATYRVDIPRDADEREGASSSFLGRVLQRKVAESFVYNFRQGRMGRNPDLIYPGQEIVIIQFPPEELVEIYKHFVHARTPHP